MSSIGTPETSAALLEARAIHLWRGDNHLLRGVSFKLRPGELIQVIGPNGVGKTSLLRAVCGLLPFESGEMLWRGHSIDRVRDAFRAELAYLGHTNALKADLTALENLRLNVHSQLSSQASEAALQNLGVGSCAQLAVGVLSAGQRRRVALARLCLSRARLWILDEPITNLDIAGISVVEDLLAQHLDGGGAVIVAAHQQLLASDRRVRSLELH